MTELIAIPAEKDLDSLLLAHNPRFVQLLEEARQRIRVTGGIPFTEFRKQIEARNKGTGNSVQEDEA